MTHPITNINTQKCTESENPPSASDEDDIWTTIPPEILVQVFGHLGMRDKLNLTLVCRSWCSAVYVPSLWKSTVVDLWTSRLTESTIASLVDLGVRRVKLMDDEGENAEKFGQLVTAMTDI